MEKHLRAAIDTKIGELRSESTVVAIEEDQKSVYIHYESAGGKRMIKAKFIVGADGKTGFVRKKYLEPKGITMEKNEK
jgi:2-polyprenyl-6-methoxyphenol hydroxylase-like FAD-dependent oxidoreductase